MAKKKDTAQYYWNEADAGLAIRESGLDRHDIFITTKYSGVDGLDIETSIQNSLKNVCIVLIYSALNDFSLSVFKILGWLLCSWESNTSICTSSIILDWLFLISQLHGGRWKISKMTVVPSIYIAISFLELYSHSNEGALGSATSRLRIFRFC